MRATKARLATLRSKLAQAHTTAKAGYDDYHARLAPLGTFELAELRGLRDAAHAALVTFDELFPEVAGGR